MYYSVFRTTLLFLGVTTVLFKCDQPKPAGTDHRLQKSYRLAMVQMTVEGGNPDANLTRAEKRIHEAAAAGASIALLPEVMDLGWTHPSARELAYEIPEGKTCKFLRKVANDNNIYVCAGLVEKASDRLYNAAVIIAPDGEVLLKHRKLNELDIAHDLYDQGEGLNVVHTPLGTLGLYICADATAYDNTLSKSLGYMGADVILSPSAWAVPPDFDNMATPYGDTWRRVYQPVSKQFGLWVVGVSNVGEIEAGPWKNWFCIGSSLAYNPAGEEVLQAPYGAKADTIIYLDIEISERPARGTKWHDYWYEKSLAERDTAELQTKP